jgi:hypothetical protein
MAFSIAAGPGRHAAPIAARPMLRRTQETFLSTRRSGRLRETSRNILKN